MAIGGKSASLLYEDERKFNIMVRYNEEFRQNEEQIGKILVPAMDGAMIPIKELADIRTITGPLLIFRDSHTRFVLLSSLYVVVPWGLPLPKHKESGSFGTSSGRIYTEMDRRF